MKDTEADALASGSGPSALGIDRSGSVSGGVGGGCPEKGSAAEGGTGYTASLGEGGGDGRQNGARVHDGSLDHHKEKRGRKRRRRRRGATKAAQAVMQPSGAVQSAAPQVTGAAQGVAQPETGKADEPPVRRKRRRRRRKTGQPVSMATHASGPQSGTALQASPGSQTPAPNPGLSSEPASRPAAVATPDFYAALDLGTNNCRLLVAVPTRPGQFRVVDAFSRIVRLGEGLSRTGVLNPLAMDRAVEALKVCRDKLRSKPVRRMRLIATEACRSAGNGIQFLERVRTETDLDLEIVDRETEARLAVSGCSSLVGRETDSVVLFDIGGGSSEIALVDVKDRRSRRLADHIVAWTSLKIGVVTLSEKFGGHHVTGQIFSDMTDYATDMLLAFKDRDRLADRVGNDGFHLLGTSGTVTTLAGIHLDLPRYDRRRVDGLWMTSGEVDAMNARLLSWSFEERVANPCIGADRADLVLAGCAILEAIRRVWPSKRLRVADRGLREGLLTEMMASDGAWRRGAGPYHNRTRWNQR